jgi:hypothetical protein
LCIYCLLLTSHNHWNYWIYFQIWSNLRHDIRKILTINIKKIGNKIFCQISAIWSVNILYFFILLLKSFKYFLCQYFDKNIFHYSKWFDKKYNNFSGRNLWLFLQEKAKYENYKIDLETNLQETNVSLCLLFTILYVTCPIFW